MLVDSRFYHLIAGYLALASLAGCESNQASPKTLQRELAGKPQEITQGLEEENPFKDIDSLAQVTSDPNVQAALKLLIPEALSTLKNPQGRSLQNFEASLENIKEGFAKIPPDIYTHSFIGCVSNRMNKTIVEESIKSIEKYIKEIKEPNINLFFIAPYQLITTTSRINLLADLFSKTESALKNIEVEAARYHTGTGTQQAKAELISQDAFKGFITKLGEIKETRRFSSVKTQLESILQYVRQFIKNKPPEIDLKTFNNDIETFIKDLSKYMKHKSKVRLKLAFNPDQYEDPAQKIAGTIAQFIDIDSNDR